MNTLDQWTDFLYKCQDEAFEEATENPEVIYTKYTKKGKSNKADVRTVTGMKLGPAGFTTQSGQAHLDEYAPGSTRITKYKKFTIAVITPEELETDMMSGGRIDRDNLEPFVNMTADMAESHEWAFEVICTDFLTRGTSPTATSTWPGAGRDGLAEFSASHVTTKGTPVTWSNSQTGASMNALVLMEGATMLENIPDETGRPQTGVKRIGIHHGRYWEWRVPELIKTLNQPDTLNNNRNAMLLRDIEWVDILNPYLSSTDTSWELIDLKNHRQEHYMKQKPTMNRDVEARTGNKIVRAVSRFAIDFQTAKGVLRNAGA